MKGHSVEERLKIKRKWHVLILTLGIIVVGIVLLLLTANGLIRLICPINFLTKLNCPGCGNTRAMIALFHLDFKSMLQYNLLFPFEMFYLLRIYVIAAKNYIKTGQFSYTSTFRVLDIIFLIVIVLWAVVRNCTDFFY